MPGRIAQSTVEPSAPTIREHVTEGISVNKAEGIQPELLKMFSVDTKNLDASLITRLKDISAWAMDGETFVGDGLMRVRAMIDKLPTLQKDKYNAVWELISLQRNIDESRNRTIDLEKRKIAIYGDGRSLRHPATL